MPKTAIVPATDDAVALLATALSQGFPVTLALGKKPRAIGPPPAAAICSLIFKMTQSEARLTVALVEHGYLGREDAHFAMCDGRMKSEITTLNVVINRVRQKLAAHGVEIITVRGQGYQLAPAGRTKVRQMLLDHGAEVAGPTASSEKVGA